LLPPHVSCAPLEDGGVPLPKKVRKEVERRLGLEEGEGEKKKRTA